MPTYQSISISLVSQYDILTIPEYPPPEQTEGDTVANLDKPVQFLDQQRFLVSVYVPVYPSSQFWISWSIDTPFAPKGQYFFKVFINQTHFVSFGCSDADEYRGKTMFGLYESAQDPMHIEKRMLFFSPEDSGSGDTQRLNHAAVGGEDTLEIRVFRAKAKKRVAPVYPVANAGDCRILDSPGCRRSDSTRLVLGGYARNIHPQRYYKYALLDPIDKPFAMFRYYFKTWTELQRLGVASPVSSPSSTGSMDRMEAHPAERHKSGLESRPETPNEKLTSKHKGLRASNSLPTIQESSEEFNVRPYTQLTHASSLEDFVSVNKESLPSTPVGKTQRDQEKHCTTHKAPRRRGILTSIVADLVRRASEDQSSFFPRSPEKGRESPVKQFREVIANAMKKSNSK